MQTMKLNDFWSEKEIQEIKEKTPKLSEHEQHGIRLHLEEILFRDICAKFPDMRKKPSCSTDILRKELSFLYR